MDYTQDMFLLSDSGYAMPFEETDKPVNLLLGYGLQKHPRTGKEFQHNGWDIEADNYVLQALATGVVIGVTTDEQQGMSLTIRYGKYDVTYRRLSHVLVNFADHVVAGKKVGTSDRFFHFGVRYGGEFVDPQDFLSMIYANMLTYQQAESDNTRIPVNDMDIHTAYDGNRDEVEQFMIKFLPELIAATYNHTYEVPRNQFQSLQQSFKDIFTDHCIFERMPSFVNPFGLGNRAKSHIERTQELLIEMVLTFTAVAHHIFLSTATEEDKKKQLTGLY